jgi:hypothetical protein
MQKSLGSGPVTPSGDGFSRYRSGDKTHLGQLWWLAVRPVFSLVVVGRLDFRCLRALFPKTEQSPFESVLESDSDSRTLFV